MIAHHKVCFSQRLSVDPEIQSPFPKASSSVSPPIQNANLARPDPYSSYTYNGARSSSVAGSTDDSHTDSEAERGGGRPSFKRLASQTLGPEQSKRPMLQSHDAGHLSGSALDDEPVHEDDSHHIPRTMMSANAAAAERTRRMSAPTMAQPAGVALTGTGYA
jgi:hypothetical protein